MSLRRPTLIVLIILVAAGLATGGWFLVRHDDHEKDDGHQQEAEGKVQYTCPMHPFIIKDQPGTCPICNMTLVKKVEGTQATDEERKALGQVALSPTQMVIANVATVPAKMEPLSREITGVGIVQFDQTRQARVTAWVAGRIDRLHVNTVGSWVSKTKPVAELYSPDLVAAQQEYLLALKSRDRLKDSSISSISQGGESLLASARQRLLLLGVKQHQITALEKGTEPEIRLPIYTPQPGVVIEKFVVEGQYVNVGDPLFNVADLSRVWVEVEVYENELAGVKVGQPVEVVSQSYPGKVFKGKVAFIYPFLDPKTRTVKVRVELANPNMMLKPDMFVSAKVKSSVGTVLTVPVGAVIDTGQRQVVWVETKPGTFEPRNVQVGIRSTDTVQILSGLHEGEKVAASGGYLIDSEAQLRGGSGQDHSQHGGTAPQPGPQPTPAMPKKNDLNMDDMKM